MLVLSFSHFNWHGTYFGKKGEVTNTGACCVRVQLHLLFVTPWTTVRQAPPSVEFSRQEYLSGLPFPPSGDLPDPEIEPASPVSPVNPRCSLYHCDTWGVTRNKWLFPNCLSLYLTCLLTKASPPHCTDLYFLCYTLGTRLVAQLVKNLPAVQESWVWSLGQEDSLEKKTTNHSSILAWKILCAVEPCGRQSMGSQTVRHHWVTNTFYYQLHFL